MLASLSIAAFAINLFIGAFVFLHDRRRVLNLVFVVMAGCLSVWSLSTFVLSQPIQDADALWWMRLLMGCAAVAPALLLHIISILFDDDARRMLRMAYVSAAVLVVMTWLGLLDSGVHRIETTGPWFRWYGSSSLLTWLLPLNALGVATYCMRALLESTERASGIRRAQAYYFLVGMIPAVVAGVHDFAGGYFQTYALLNVSFAPLFPIASAFWSALAGYTILRYRLIDLDEAITRGMVRSLTLAVLVIPFFLLLVAAQQAYHGEVYLDFSMLTLAICTFAAFIVPPLSTAAERKIGNAIFGRSRGYRESLVAFSHEASRILDLETLIERVCETFTATLEVRSATVYVARDPGCWELRGQRGRSRSRLPPTLDENDALIDRFMERGDTLVREELEFDSQGGDAARDVAREMASMGAAVAIPLKTPEALEGVITLGARADGAVFTQEDLEVLTILANQLATAMANARLYADLKRSREMIERSERLSAIGTMAAGLAHEIRNPLVSIRTFTQLLPERIEDAEFREQFLDLTLSEVDRICTLINELLAFARPAPAELRLMDVDDCLGRICMLLQSQAKGRSVKLIKNDPGRDCTPGDVSITADEDQVKQVVMNLILNAIQACPEGGTVEVVTSPTTCENRRFVCVEITDDGVGMEEDLVSHIFDPFFTTRREGTGLGLSIAHQIVTRHGGFIDVRSSIGEGTSFFLHFPVVPTESEITVPSYEAEDLRLHG